jgi:hypothetical protein
MRWPRGVAVLSFVYHCWVLIRSIPPLTYIDISYIISVSNKYYTLSMLSLLDLPDELLLLIFDKLNNGDCYRDWYARDNAPPLSTFYALSLVCCRLNGLATPYLYSTITPMQDMAPVLSTIIKHQRTAERVLHLYWDCIICLQYTSTMVTQSCIEAVRNDTNFPNFGINLLQAFQYYSKQTPTFLATLLCFVPNLRHLSVSDKSNSSSFHISWFHILSAGPAHGYFKNLTRLRLATAALQLNTILHVVFQLPRLKTLHIEDLHQPIPLLHRLDPYTHRKRLTLKELFLSGFCMDPSAVAKLLQCISGLRKLDIRFLSHSRIRGLSASAPYYAALTQAVLTQRKTLDTLKIFDVRNYTDLILSRNQTTFGPLLSTATRLTHFACHINALGRPQLGVDPSACLPESLCMLALVVDPTCVNWMQILEALARRCEWVLGNLERVDVLLPWWVYGWLFHTGRLGLEFNRWDIKLEFDVGRP